MQCKWSQVFVLAEINERLRHSKSSRRCSACRFAWPHDLWTNFLCRFFPHIFFTTKQQNMYEWLVLRLSVTELDDSMLLLCTHCRQRAIWLAIQIPNIQCHFIFFSKPRTAPNTFSLPWFIRFRPIPVPPFFFCQRHPTCGSSGSNLGPNWESSSGK